MILTVAQTHPHKGDILKNIKQHKRLIDIAVSYNTDKVIFPGVGEASSAMKYLKERGLDELLKN